MKRIEAILKANNDDNKRKGVRVNRYNREKILVDHNVEETIEQTLELGMRCSSQSDQKVSITS